MLNDMQRKTLAFHECQRSVEGELQSSKLPYLEFLTLSAVCSFSSWLRNGSTFGVPRALSLPWEMPAQFSRTCMVRHHLKSSETYRLFQGLVHEGANVVLEFWKGWGQTKTPSSLQYIYRIYTYQLWIL